MRILFVTSELAGYIKAGGLADVSTALPTALNHRGEDVRLLIPGFPAITSTMELTTIATLPGLAQIPECSIARGTTSEGTLAYVIVCDPLYARAGSPYTNSLGTEWSDNDVRFARLALAAAQIAEGVAGIDWTPDLLHIHDWHGALAPGYLAWRQRAATPTITTIHNLAHQGIYGRDRLGALGIPDRAFRIDGPEFYGQLSFLKTGIYYADEVTTVSPTYATEITTEALGCGLHGLLAGIAQEGRLTGIVNGVDDSWDPKTDPYLVRRFDISSRGGKRRNADVLREQLGLTSKHGPLFSLIARMVYQKGVDLAIGACETIVKAGGQLIVMGTGEAALERGVGLLAKKYPGSVSVTFGYEEPVAHRVFAASDFFLMPSRYEPCGLTQMYAQRFGALPVARETGGLRDTIDDGITGFMFPDISVGSLVGAIKRAILMFNFRPGMNNMQRAAMSRDFSWTSSALEYERVYERVYQRARTQSAAPSTASRRRAPAPLPQVPEPIRPR
ncbi:glycogen synthase GlgA [soil metagenome]